MDNGASDKSDRAVAASAVQPVPVSPVPASIPSAWVVMRSVGEYSDRWVTPVAVFATNAEAEAYILAADEQWRVTSARLPNSAWDADDADAYEAEWARALTVDPGACPASRGYADQPYYSIEETPCLDAQAIETRRAATLGAVEDESAVGATDAPATPSTETTR